MRELERANGSSELGCDAPQACATAVVPTRMPAGVNVLHGRAKIKDARRELRSGTRGAPIACRGNRVPDTAARTRLQAWGEDVQGVSCRQKHWTQESTNRQACCGRTLHKELHEKEKNAGRLRANLGRRVAPPHRQAHCRTTLAKTLPRPDDERSSGCEADAGRGVDKLGCGQQLVPTAVLFVWLVGRLFVYC